VDVIRTERQNRKNMAICMKIKDINRKVYSAAKDDMKELEKYPPQLWISEKSTLEKVPGRIDRATALINNARDLNDIEKFFKAKDEIKKAKNNLVQANHMCHSVHLKMEGIKRAHKHYYSNSLRLAKLSVDRVLGISDTEEAAALKRELDALTYDDAEYVDWLCLYHSLQRVFFKAKLIYVENMSQKMLSVLEQL
jgi:hypothetical protein